MRRAGISGAGAVAAIAVSLAAPAPAAPPQAAAAFEDLAAIVTAKMAEYGVPGVAFGLARNGRVTARGFGVTNVEDPLPVTPDTVFPVASISKIVTATAIMRLVEQGRLELDAPVHRYLPDFRVGDDTASRTVTIAHLLTHTPGWEGQLTPEDRGVDTLARFVESMRDLPMLAAPGEVWSYNNAGFSVAGRIIEVATGQTIHDAFRTLVFEPVGLTRAFTRLEDVATHRLSVAHRGAPGRAAVIRPMMRSSSIAAGGVSMSLADVLGWAAFHLGDGTARGGARVLSRASIEAMRAPRVPKHGTDDAMGIGWHLRTVGGVVTAAHGGTLGHTLLVEIVPARGLALAILTNHSSGWQLIQDVEREALRRLEGLALDPAQGIGHRGVNETMPGAPALSPPPDPAPYAGVYRRPPSGSYTVRVEDGQVRLDQSVLSFYAPDRAVVASGASRGNPVEFIRDASGAVRWVRVVGRIARKE